MDNHMLRHYLATLSYRTTIAINAAPLHYSTFNIGKGARTPVEILNHITFLMAYVIHCYKEIDLDDYRNQSMWETEVSRFYVTFEQLDFILSEGLSPNTRTIEQLIQGPFADAMTHVGQLTLIRRLAGSPVTYENFMNADIHIGQIH
jgi:hypothetical protein